MVIGVLEAVETVSKGEMGYNIERQIVGQDCWIDVIICVAVAYEGADFLNKLVNMELDKRLLLSEGLVGERMAE